MKDKGITLIALIITIIIMLILVGVTISATLNTGLFKVSQEGIFKKALAQLDEQLYGIREINKYTGQTGDYSNMIPEELKPYISVTDVGRLVYTGDENAVQKQWAEDLKIYPLSNNLKSQVIIHNNRVLLNHKKEIDEELIKEAEEFGIKQGTQDYILKTTLEELISLAKKYIEEGNSTKSSNLLALQYIRFQNSNYRSGNWKTLGGEIELGFVNYVNRYKSDIFSINDIKDPVTGETIDFVHSMASLNVYVNQASSSDPLKQYACWAGDLCTFTEEIYQYYKSGNYTEAELKEYTNSKLGGSSTFGLADMLADADAVNIAELAKSEGDMDDIIYDYYYGNNSEKCKNRYNSFATYLKSIKSSSATSDEGRIYDTAMYYLGKNGGFWVGFYAPELIDSYSSIPDVVFETVSTCFAEYICERM